MIDLNAADCAPQHVRYDLDRLVGLLRDTALSWVPSHFPNGRRENTAWRLGGIDGRPPRKQGSCVITLEGRHAGDWIDFDGSGQGGPLSALEQVTGRSGRTLFAYAAELVGLDLGPVAAHCALRSDRAVHRKVGVAAEIAHILAQAIPLAGTPAAHWLASRGLVVPELEDLRFAADLTHYPSRSGWPALVAIVRGKDGAQIGLHRTYLAPDGVAKAPVVPARMALGEVHGGAVRLASPREGLIGLAEGIETALSVMTACPDLPMWAALSAGNLAAQRLPPEITRVVICADNDAGGAGLAAARELAGRLQDEGRAVFLAAPPAVGDDFNDVLRRDGPGAVRSLIMDAQRIDGAALAEPAVEHSEDALALAFTARHGADWRHVALWGAWLAWTGTRWEREGTLRAFDLARKVCREATNSAPGAKLRAKLSQASTIAAVERLARADRRHAATAEEWDRDPWALNTPDGVLDLRTGQLGPHDRALAMTKLATATPQDGCPAWRAFLDTVTGRDPELQAYLARMVGYCLTGITSEHALFFLYGTGANGKSVFANTLTALLGDYAAVAPMDMFMATAGERHPTDMAGLRGARIVTSIETEQGSRWAESKLKALTGGDRITARFMRQDFFEFTPQFKLLVVGNHKPAIRNVDEAMRRRLHMVPFTVTIPVVQRDKQLPERLLAERNGILAWAMAGCLEWQRTGLRPPPAVLAATDAYFDAEDALGRWLEERCEQHPSYTEPSSFLFANWKSWAEVNGEFAGSIKRFAENLGARGFERWRDRQAKGFRGLRLRQGSQAISGVEFG